MLALIYGVRAQQCSMAPSATIGSALNLGFYLPHSGRLTAIALANQGTFPPNTWLELSTAGAITI